MTGPELLPLLAGPLLVAVLVARGRGRWMPWTVGAIALAPAILFVLVWIVAAILDTGTASSRNLAFGIMLIASVAALPWLAVCGVGIGLGLVLRRLFPPPALPPSAPPAFGRSPRPAPLPLAQRFAAWRSALVILALALAAIAGLTAATLHLSPAPPQVLTPLPTMPGRAPRRRRRIAPPGAGA